MATRPDVLPELAMLDVDLPNTGNVNKLRPPIEVRETGYDYLQKPPAEEFNWLLNNIAQWIDYLDSLTRDQGVTDLATKQQAEQGTSEDTLMTPKTTLDSIKFNAIPAGNVQHTARTTAPSGWLVCDGATVSRTTYSKLYDAIGDTFGAGDGSTTFGLPDLRDEFIRGANIGGGRSVGTTESSMLGSHAHTGSTASAGTHSHSLPSNADDGTGNTWIADSAGNSVERVANTGSAGAHTHSVTINAAGGAETRPQNVALLPIIKF